MWEAVLQAAGRPEAFTGKSPGRKHLLSGIADLRRVRQAMGTAIRADQAAARGVVYQCKRLGCMKIVRDLAKTDKLVIGIITERLAEPEAAREAGHAHRRHRGAARQDRHAARADPTKPKPNTTRV